MCRNFSASKGNRKLPTANRCNPAVFPQFPQLHTAQKVRNFIFCTVLPHQQKPEEIPQFLANSIMRILISRKSWFSIL